MTRLYRIFLKVRNRLRRSYARVPDANVSEHVVEPRRRELDDIEHVRLELIAVGRGEKSLVCRC